MAASVSPDRLRLTVSEWFRTRCRPLPLVLGAAILAGPYFAGPARAEGPFNRDRQAAKAQAGSRRTPVEADESTAPDAKVKLNYFAVPWEKVLRDVAEATGSELVADRVPAGRFTRRDGAEYNRADAVRIINREIEPLGFRLIEKGNFLIVLDLPSQRPRYQAPVVPKPTSEPPQYETVNPITPPQRLTRQFDRVTPRTAQPQRSDGGVQQASHETESVTDALQPPPGAALNDRVPAAQEPATMVVFRARNQQVTDLAKQLYRTFKERADLVESGRNQLPAFQVRGGTASTATAVQFAVAIDADREELLIDARPSQADALLKLLRRLDVPGDEAEPLQLVSTTRTVCQVAAQLPAVADKIRADRDKPARVFPADADDPLADAFAQVDAAAQPQPPQAGDQPGTMVIPRSGQVGDIVGNLKGEVTIEAVEALGVLILKGNQRDLEQVMQVIKQLEELSEQTAPQVHLLYLTQVNSEALAELLTTVYERLTEFPGPATQPRQNVAILPVSKPNAVLIIAPKNDLPSILQLAEELDKKVDPESEVQVFRLQSAIAPRVEEMITEFYEEREGLGTRVIVRSDVRTNSLIVSAKPRDLDEIGTLIRKIDADESDTVSKMEIFPLKNAVATELSAIINSAIQSVLSPPSNQGASQVFGQGFGAGAAQVDEAFQDVRSTLLQFKAVDADGERLLKSGILSDIRVTPDPRMNALIVAAPEASLSLIGALIKQLDQPTSAVAEIKVFTLANADATLMVQQLQGLFNAQTTGQQGQGGQQRLGQGFQVAGAEDASSGLIPIRFSVDTRTNSVIAVGAADALRVVEAIMLRLDESDIRERQNTVYRLKNSPAATIATAITQFMTSQRDITQQDPNLISTVEQLEREVIVVAETVSNSLLISATPRYNDEILRLIKKLDEPPAQVIIQALIVEVELQDTDEFGVELGFQDSILFDRSIVDQANTFTTTTTTTENNVTTTQTNIISQALQPGFLFGNPNTPLGNSTGGRPTNAVGTQGLSNFSLGRVNGDLGFGGLVLSASSESVSVLLRALSANRQVRVLSRPQIRTMDNQVATIQQGQNVPIVQGVTLAATGVANPNVQRDDAGVILTVQPRITPDGNIVMALTAEKSQYDLTGGVPIFTDASTGNVVTSPVKNISTANTTIMVPNGQTVVLGGLITSRTDEAHRKVPWLGDIPVLGYAFRYDYQQTLRTELLIFLTPRIITDDCESETIKEIEMGRMHFIESEAEEIHGPLRGVPEQDWISPGMIIDGPSTTIMVPTDTPPATPPVLPPQPDPKLQPVMPEPPLPSDLKPLAPPPPAENEANLAPPQPGDTIVDPNITPVGSVRLGGTRPASGVRTAVAEFEAPAKKSHPLSLPKSSQKPSVVKLGRKPWSSPEEK
uniref:Type II secretion system protein GspD n=1 Tax=Schlesneria paludicola TaxID=360056 RepID=A0A7C2P133_9PLAN